MARQLGRSAPAGRKSLSGAGFTPVSVLGQRVAFQDSTQRWQSLAESACW